VRLEGTTPIEDRLRREVALETGMAPCGVLTRPALLAFVVITAGCGSPDKAGALEPVERYLVYEKAIGEKGIWIADVDGSSPRLLFRDGQLPVISPDGKWVAYFGDCTASDFGCTYVVSTAGGKPRLLTSRRIDEEVTWSPTSDRIVSISAPSEEQPEQYLVSIDVASGDDVTLARGGFLGWSFSPDGKRIVFALGDAGLATFETDLYVTMPEGGAERITDTGNSSYPVWGPDSIAFAKQVQELWRIQPDGTGLTRVTGPLPKRLVARHGRGGLIPIDWSEDGRVLLAGLTGDRGTEPMAVDPETGSIRDLGLFGRPFGVATNALSRDGRSALVKDGAFAETPLEQARLLIVPVEGGKATVVASGIRTASWNR
jgi:dipeptidyl aminopeptidase/acylaminoacyl peptidase